MKRSVVAVRFTELSVNPLQKGDETQGVRWEDDGLFEVEHFFVIEYELSDGLVIRVELKPGFVFNMRSGPALLDIWIPKTGTASPIWAGHDGMYEDPSIPRVLADSMMRFGLQSIGLKPWQAALAYRGVRVFGKSGYTFSTRQARHGLVNVIKMDKEQAHMSAPPMIGVPWHREFHA